MPEREGESEGDVTRILNSVGGRGSPADAGAAERLLPLVYRELCDLAAQRMNNERPGQTLSATALVHEAYVRLVGDVAGGAAPRWHDRGHFFAAAAEAMRRILVDNARRKRRPKHGGGRERIDLDQALLVAPSRGGGHDDDLLALDEALTRLAAEAPAKAAVVKLRYFAGLSVEESALALGISPATAKRHWAYARAWLHCALSDSPEPSDR
jgi:RNA polymerase sigma factor (TIGR02999 family)